MVIIFPSRYAPKGLSEQARLSIVDPEGINNLDAILGRVDLIDFSMSLTICVGLDTLTLFLFVAMF